MKRLVFLIELLVTLAALALLAARAVTSPFSHDENKFVYAGQALADQRLLPYLDYPYDQMPYTVPFYAFSAWLSPFDFLAARLLGAVVWLACIITIMAILHACCDEEKGGPGAASGLWLLLTEVVLVSVLLLHPVSAYVLGSAKNNSFATLFALLAIWVFARAVRGSMPVAAAAFWSGLLIIFAGCARLNYLGLFVVLAFGWLAYAWTTGSTPRLKLLGRYAAGGIVGSLPLLALAALAPAQTYYANIVQLRLTTIYFQQLLYRFDMDMASKLRTFVRQSLRFPASIALYVMSLAAGVAFIRLRLRRRQPAHLVALLSAAFAAALLATAFMATPMMTHYLWAPLPFLLVLVGIAAQRLLRWRRWAYGLALAALLGSLSVSSLASDSVHRIGALRDPASWPPMQIHRMAQDLRAVTGIRQGPVLSLLPMIPAEAGYPAYPFTASGSNSWRTSLLLTAQRRRDYGVVSPDELAGVLQREPPAGILVGFESPNPGFTFQDMGGLELPFAEYARQHGYVVRQVENAISGRRISVWVAPP